MPKQNVKQPHNEILFSKKRNELNNLGEPQNVCSVKEERYKSPHTV